MVANHLGCRHDFTQKTPDGGQTWGRHRIMPHESVLQVEDVISTAKTLEQVLGAINQKNPSPRLEPFILALINRSRFSEWDSRRILCLAKVEAKTWLPDQCPLCKKDSTKILDPKSWNNQP
ncbi:MAG: hypothetical protein JNN11_01810 [Candidatus Doudnabacteria bacterium]|nr:hypothetical protein [Candidatus Doudnabacteria bacterium]